MPGLRRTRAHRARPRARRVAPPGGVVRPLRAPNPLHAVGRPDLRAELAHLSGPPVESPHGTPGAGSEVDLPAFVIVALRRHRESLGGSRIPNGSCSRAPRVTPIRRSNLHRRSYKPLLKRAKLPEVTFHALRHTAATLALAAGVKPKVVQERLGHSTA